MSDVFVYYSYTDNYHPENLQVLKSIFNIQEKQRYSKLIFEKDRKNFIIAHSLVRFALKVDFNLPVHIKSIDFKVNEPPTIKKDSKSNSINISLSHTNNFVICAISKNIDIGIDAEFIEQKDYSDIYPYCLTKAEKKQIHKSDNSTQTFLKIWTRKEAFLKGIKKGFGVNPLDIECDLKSNELKDVKAQFDDINKWETQSLNISSDHICSIAYKRKDQKKINIKDNELFQNDVLSYFQNTRIEC